MYRKRLLSPALKRALAQFPAVLITGPRQSGKTTFLRQECGRASYVSLDEPQERQFALSDPNGFLDRFAGRSVILDEVQNAPELLPYLKGRIDAARDDRGRWILTGSQQFALMRGVSESLAGRVAILELLPFSTLELGSAAAASLEQTVVAGLYPEPALHPDRRSLWLRSYVQTYIERDIRQLQNIRNLRSFETFVGLCAARHGQEFSPAGLGREAGVSLPTAKAWAGLLEASYVCRLLRPYFRNYGKRLVKSPKLYFHDPGLVSALTRQPNGEAALAGPLGGALLEGLVVAETWKIFAAAGLEHESYFWRTRDGMEVDLIVRAGGRLHPIEVKLTATPTRGHCSGLDRFRKIAKDEAADGGLVVCRVRKEVPLPFGNRAIPWQEYPAWLQDRLR
jgi:hypothetical protein